MVVRKTVCINVVMAMMKKRRGRGGWQLMTVDDKLGGWVGWVERGQILIFDGRAYTELTMVLTNFDDDLMILWFTSSSFASRWNYC